MEIYWIPLFNKASEIDRYLCVYSSLNLYGSDNKYFMLLNQTKT
jgi:hypothetical protein